MTATGNQDCFNMSGAFTIKLTITTPASNQSPTANAGGPYSGAEGSSIQLDGSGSNDTDGTITYDWTINTTGIEPGGSCSFDDNTLENPQVTCTDDGVFTATLTVTDDDGAMNDDDATVTVGNANPSATPSVPSSVNEGSNINLLLGSPSDPGANDTFTYQFDCGDGGGYSAPSATASRSCLTMDNGSRSVKLKIIDDDGGVAEYTDTVTVNNVAPSVVITGDSPVSESGDLHTYAFNTTDPGTADTFTHGTASCGASGVVVGAVTFSSTTGDGSFDCRFADDDPTNTASDTSTVSITITDDDTDAGTGSKDVTVNNVAPAITGVAGPSAPIALGGVAIVSASFTDVGSQDTHTCVFSWDDGSPNTTVNAPGNGNGTCSASHMYAGAGVYGVDVAVTDDDTESATSKFEFVVVYDPSAGFVTGGGWIDSPTGAYRTDPSLNGRGTFGFVSKYKKGATVPEGQTEFQLHFASFNFHSSSYQWLVLSANGTKAQYKGNGTINGAGSYGFLLTAYDGSPDRFRIKIWNTATSNVVYDNRIGMSDDIDAADPQAIGSGSIVIHTPKK
ncbi:MAG: PKD domain-containing protein [Gaiellaceae bacterium]